MVLFLCSTDTVVWVIVGIYHQSEEQEGGAALCQGRKSGSGCWGAGGCCISGVAESCSIKSCKISCGKDRAAVTFRPVAHQLITVLVPAQWQSTVGEPKHTFFLLFPWAVFIHVHALTCHASALCSSYLQLWIPSICNYKCISPVT